MSTRNARTLTKQNMVAMAKALMGSGVNLEKLAFTVDRHRRRVRGTINGLPVFDMSRRMILLHWRLRYGK